MERLTVRGEHGITMADGWDFCIDPDDYDLVQKILARLAAYEDTGLEPGDIKAVRERENGLAQLLTQVSCNCAVTYTRLRELAQAEKDGRLVALPCKVGDTVYQTDGVRIYSHTIRKLIYDAGPFDFDERAVNKTVFLTREEAEAALAREGVGMNQIKMIREHIDRPELLALLAEELVEASHAALKLRRAITDADPTPVTEDKAYSKLIEELGDISAVLEVLGLNSGMARMKVDASKAQKLARWVERLEEGGEKPNVT